MTPAPESSAPESRVPAPGTSSAPESARASEPGAPAHSISAIVVSYNRREALLTTLRALRAMPPIGEIIVVDNGSRDRSVEALRTDFPNVRVLALDANTGVAAFNRGVEAALGELVLILDDDARPEPEALRAAAALLEARSDLAAVTFHPKHPATGVSEWRAAERAKSPTDRWPFMGCANLVRRADWARVGGYEERYFLYRNDTDLALKLLGAGRAVHMNPAWIAWHDSPAAARKSARWCRLATRNWMWTVRRHGRGRTALAAALLAWAWAHRLAGWSASRQWAVLRGVGAGLGTAPPSLPLAVQRTGAGLAEALRLQWRR